MPSFWRLAIAIVVSGASGDGSAELASHVLATAPKGDIEAALKKFIGFSERNGLGMHLGEEKGELIKVAVGRGLPDSGPAVVFEAGCHAGDGTLSAAAALRERAGSTIVSTETNEHWLDAARRVVGHATANMDLRYLPLRLRETADFGAFLDSLRDDHGIPGFDAVVFDHDEALFLPHLEAILAKGFLRPGATVEIDNVVRKKAQLREYMDFVSEKAGNGFNTEVKHVRRPYPDAIAISTYVGKKSEL
mmetsp:Transcript_29716/g.81368  ORF Transcript_29716/g.81368 Transcript_29716/m.81368 type:complete len:248 (+) Transcript_29716:49-792(+)